MKYVRDCHLKSDEKVVLTMGCSLLVYLRILILELQHFQCNICRIYSFFRSFLLLCNLILYSFYSFNIENTKIYSFGFCLCVCKKPNVLFVRWRILLTIRNAQPIFTSNTVPHDLTILILFNNFSIHHFAYPFSIQYSKYVITYQVLY